MGVRDHLPVNGAGAVNLPDPQEKPIMAKPECAYCERGLYPDDEIVVLHTGEEESMRFCDDRCLVDWLNDNPGVLLEILKTEGVVTTEFLWGEL
jgi:hypothetical protein